MLIEIKLKEEKPAENKKEMEDKDGKNNDDKDTE